MEARKPPRQRTNAKRADAAAPVAAPGLPAWKAFVVQFTVDSGSGSGGTFAGRVEHLASRRRVRFATAPELIACLRELLDQVDE